MTLVYITNTSVYEQDDREEEEQKCGEQYFYPYCGTVRDEMRTGYVLAYSVRSNEQSWQ